MGSLSPQGDMTLTDIHRIQFLSVASISRTYSTVFLTMISIYSSTSPRSYCFRNAYNIRRPESSFTGRGEVLTTKMCRTMTISAGCRQFLRGKNFKRR